jgi:hypothetical protein
MSRRKVPESGLVTALSLTGTPAGTTFPHDPTSVGGERLVIANCPSCGTHYKHEPPKAPVTVRCGRCDTALDLTRFRPYRIVREQRATEDDARRAATYLPIGLDHPNLAATIAVNIAQPPPTPLPAAPHTAPDHHDRSPSMPEIVLGGAVSERPAPAHAETRSAAVEVETETRTSELDAPEPEGWSGFVLWVATAAVAGTAASWSLDGTTTSGLAVGAAIGAAAWWAWRRWTSPS